MSKEYNPDSVDAVLSRIETKLDTVLQTQGEHASAIRKLWAALGKIDVRVAGISAVVGLLIALAKIWFSH